MKKIIVFGGIAALLILAVTAYEHSSGDGIGRLQYFGGMHDDMEDVLESGTYEDLQNLRLEYGMPVLHWIDSEEDFAEAKERHEEFESAPQRYGGCHGWRQLLQSLSYEVN